VRWTGLILFVIGIAVSFGGVQSIVQAGTDSTCYVMVKKDFWGNYDLSTMKCNTPTCAVPAGAACQIRSASGSPPGTTWAVCACEDNPSIVHCEMVHIYPDGEPDEGELACPNDSKCTRPDTCDEGSLGSYYYCACQ